MGEAEFWVSLEYRICREFAGMRQQRLRRLWCDGVIPSQYVLDGPRPQISGTAWIGDGPRQAKWEFALLLPRPVAPRKEIEWAAVLQRLT